MSASNPTRGAGLVPFVPGATREPERKLYLGLDLGQRRDHSALAVVELKWIQAGRCAATYAWLYQPELVIRTLKRFPLGVSYDDIHERVADRIEEIDKEFGRTVYQVFPKKNLIIDAGGPGPPVVDRLRRSVDNRTYVRPVIITGGKGANSLTGGYTGIPRRTLISNLLMAVNTHSLRIPPEIEGFRVLVDEIVELSGNSTHPDNPGAHDDMVMGLALAVNGAVTDTPKLVPGSSRTVRPEPDFGFVNKRLF